jgi:hypothetical protein
MYTRYFYVAKSVPFPFAPSQRCMQPRENIDVLGYEEGIVAGEEWHQDFRGQKRRVRVRCRGMETHRARDVWFNLAGPSLLLPSATRELAHRSNHQRQPEAPAAGS